MKSLHLLVTCHLSVDHELFERRTRRRFGSIHAQSFSSVAVSPNVESSSTCPHLLNYRICPCRATYHPEFTLRHDQILWLPRTWICRALQRSLRHDGSGTMSCPIQDCPYTPMPAIGPPLNRWHSVPWHFAPSLTTLAYYTIYNLRMLELGLYNGSALHQHNSYYAPKRF